MTDWQTKYRMLNRASGISLIVSFIMALAAIWFIYVNRYEIAVIFAAAYILLVIVFVKLSNKAHEMAVKNIREEIENGPKEKE